jgi:hypothetical protein
MSIKPKFRPYNHNEKYDIILLLAGENTATDKGKNEIQANPNYYPRSKKAAQIMQTGNIKNGILVTGGYGGFDQPLMGISGGERTFNYLALIEKIPDNFLFFDEKSRETLGNFAMPAEYPEIMTQENGIKASPDFNELESILLITEEGHMGRALECAAKVLPYGQMDYLAVEGPYKPGFVTKAYHSSLMQATRHITKPNPGKVVEFLESEHPFYKYGDEKWFRKSLNMRRVELAVTCAGWYAGANQNIRIKITQK